MLRKEELTTRKLKLRKSKMEEQYLTALRLLNVCKSKGTRLSAFESSCKLALIEFSNYIGLGETKEVQKLTKANVEMTTRDYNALQFKILLFMAKEFGGKPRFVIMIKKSTSDINVKDILSLILMLVECHRRNKCNTIQCTIKYCTPLLKLTSAISVKLMTSVPRTTGVSVDNYKEFMNKYKSLIKGILSKLKREERLTKMEIDELRSTIQVLISFINGR